MHQVELNKFRMRVWERGGGITLACGSGACAVAVAFIGLVVDREATKLLWMEDRFLLNGKMMEPMVDG